MSFINIRQSLYDLSQPRVMGILNITPDSFFKGSRTTKSEEILSRATNMVEAGVDIIDIGGYSSRPGAADISVENELDRVKAALDIVRTRFPQTIISVDTFRTSVAKVAVEQFGVEIINDISGGIADPEMTKFIANANVAYIMMHMRGTPTNMQDNPHYDDLVNELIIWFSERLNKFRLSGVTDIIIDPGFGFGKTIEHNYTILRHLEKLKILGCPIMAGVSRKSMIWNELEGKPESESSLTGTVALNAVALLKGASIIRVHDVSEAVITIKMIQRVHGVE